MPANYGYGSNGIKPTKIQIEQWTFDSLFEGQVYQLLRSQLDNGDIRVHYPFTIFKKSDRYPEWNHEVDFYIPKINVWIEAKGVWTRDFTTLVRAIDSHHPQFLDRYIVVTPKGGERICKGKNAVPMNYLPQLLQNMLSHLKK